MSTWLDGSWEKTSRIDEKDESIRWHTHCKGGAGVYRLVSFTDASGDELSKIPRICGVDHTGTLYIGQTNNLFRRVADLVRSYVSGYQSQVYSEFPAVLAAQHPPERLGICWEYCPDQEVARLREAELLRRYVGQFGERPPRNKLGGGS